MLLWVLIIDFLDPPHKNFLRIFTIYINCSSTGTYGTGPSPARASGSFLATCDYLLRESSFSPVYIKYKPKRKVVNMNVFSSKNNIMLIMLFIITAILWHWQYLPQIRSQKYIRPRGYLDRSISLFRTSYFAFAGERYSYLVKFLFRSRLLLNRQILNHQLWFSFRCLEG